MSDKMPEINNNNNIENSEPVIDPRGGVSAESERISPVDPIQSNPVQEAVGNIQNTQAVEPIVAGSTQSEPNLNTISTNRNPGDANNPNSTSMWSDALNSALNPA